MNTQLLKALIFIFIFTSCSHSLIRQGQDGIIIYAIRKENNFNLATQGLVNQSKGEAYDKKAGKVKEFYQTKKQRFDTIDRARNYFCTLFQTYAKPYNSDLRLKEYFDHFPLTAHELEIEVTFVDVGGVALSPPFIAQVKNVAGKIYYYSYDSHTKQFLLLLEESYENAVNQF